MINKKLHVPDHKFDVVSFSAISLMDNGLTREDVINIVAKSGMEKGLKEIEAITKTKASFVVNAGCCAFTKNPNNWYFFPIHNDQLDNVGLEEKDLVKWIDFLNSTKAGFDYLYLGKHSFKEKFKSTSGGITDFPTYNTTGEKAHDFYWVVVPAFPGADFKISYVHWVFLRYLIGTIIIGIDTSLGFPKNNCSPYYLLPRRVLFLNEELGVLKFKSLLYAHLSGLFYSGYGLSFTDRFGKVNEANLKFNGYTSEEINNQKKAYAAPCVRVSAKTFKTLLSLPSCNNTLNSMLTQANYDYTNVKEHIIVKDLSAPYDINKLLELFADEKYEEFVKEIKESYKTKK